MVQRRLHLLAPQRRGPVLVLCSRRGRDPHQLLFPLGSVRPVGPLLANTHTHTHTQHVPTQDAPSAGVNGLRG